ncbi:hypothetical protein J6590_095182 [Homalodisca vitripennis]|nr:hypothetical protein J6590_095182 [Homalodisca vitripennis]
MDIRGVLSLAQLYPTRETIALSDQTYSDCNERRVVCQVDVERYKVSQMASPITDDTHHCLLSVSATTGLIKLKGAVIKALELESGARILLTYVESNERQSPVGVRQWL